jgi:hypothetical protein
MTLLRGTTPIFETKTHLLRGTRVVFETKMALVRGTRCLFETKSGLVPRTRGIFETKMGLVPRTTANIETKTGVVPRLDPIQGARCKWFRVEAQDLMSDCGWLSAQREPESADRSDVPGQTNGSTPRSGSLPCHPELLRRQQPFHRRTLSGLQFGDTELAEPALL